MLNIGELFSIVILNDGENVILFSVDYIVIGMVIVGNVIVMVIFSMVYFWFFIGIFFLFVGRWERGVMCVIVCNKLMVLGYYVDEKKCIDFFLIIVIVVGGWFVVCCVGGRYCVGCDQGDLFVGK